eukprot:16450102-Heterocapsa_arctica.AAC.1
MCSGTSCANFVSRGLCWFTSCRQLACAVRAAGQMARGPQARDPPTAFDHPLPMRIALRAASARRG